MEEELWLELWSVGIIRAGEVILYYYGFPLTDQEYDQKYSVFTAPYTVGSKTRPDAPLVDSALFRSVAALANHRPEHSCNANFEAVYPTPNHTGPFRYAIVASKDIKGGREIYVNYGRVYKMNTPGSAYHATQSVSKKALIFFNHSIKKPTPDFYSEWEKFLLL